MIDFNSIPTVLDEIKRDIKDLRKEIEARLHPKDTYPDVMSLDTLLFYLKSRYDIEVSRSKIYKLTQGSGAGGIPRRRFGNRLLFNRREIDAWVDRQINKTQTPKTTSYVTRSFIKKHK